MDEERRLIDRLRKIEALFARPGTSGEQAAAGEAAARLRDRLDEVRSGRLHEHRFTMPDMWSRRLLVALLRRSGIEPYRYTGQRYTTVMAMATEDFVNNSLWPEFQEHYKVLNEYLHQVTQRVIVEAIHGDVSDPAERRAPARLGDGG